MPCYGALPAFRAVVAGRDSSSLPTPNGHLGELAARLNIFTLRPQKICRKCRVEWRDEMSRICKFFVFMEPARGLEPRTY
jgi:hypothetical protein